MAQIIDHDQTIDFPDADRGPMPREARQRAGGVAALVAATTYVIGIVMFATTLGDYTSGDPTPAESVRFVSGHQTSLFLWYLVILIGFGMTLVPMALALRTRLRAATPQLADASAAFGLIWAGLMFATGTIANVGIEVVADLAASHPDQAPAVWSSIDAVTNGLGGGNELVGGVWVLLVSVAAWSAAALPRPLSILGIISGVAGLATLAPGFELAEMAFGLGLIAWFVGIGVTLISNRRPLPGA